MITLIGHGYVGQHIAALLQDQHYNWIRHQDPIPLDTSVIINAAGYTGSPNVDACEIHRRDTIEGNVVFPLSLEHDNPDTPVVHITSGCVYTGYVDQGYTEQDPPNFDFENGSFYSGSKALAQRLLEPHLHKSYLLRIRMPFGDRHNPKNFLTKLHAYPRLIDFRNSVSNVHDVARVAVFMAQERPEPGIYNVCNPGSVTTREVADLMGLEKSWFTEQEFRAAVTAPRSNCVLNTDKLQQIFPLNNALDSVRDTVKKLTY